MKTYTEWTDGSSRERTVLDIAGALEALVFDVRSNSKVAQMTVMEEGKGCVLYYYVDGLAKRAEEIEELSQT